MKKIKPKLDINPVTCKAVTVFRHQGELLSETVELEIVNGVVVSQTKLTRAPDSFNLAIAKATKKLWELIKSQNEETLL